LACSGPGAGALIASNGLKAQSFGIANLVLLGMIAASQYARVRASLSTWILALATGIGFTLFRPGWNYSGLHGDCGTQESQEAMYLTWYLAALSVLQIIAWIRCVAGQPSKASVDHPDAPIADPGF
jgi:hypothetical protein